MDNIFLCSLADLYVHYRLYVVLLIMCELEIYLLSWFLFSLSQGIEMHLISGTEKVAFWSNANMLIFLIDFRNLLSMIMTFSFGFWLYMWFYAFVFSVARGGQICSTFNGHGH